MVRLVVALLVGSLIWMCWWAFGQIAYEKGMRTWVEDRRSEGWAADYADLATRGFPNRFDTTISQVALADPGTGIAWSAPFVQFLSLAYKPHQVIAVLPDTHRFSTPVQTLTFTHEDARASLFLEPSTELALDRARLVLENLGATSTLGWTISLDQGRFAAERVAARPKSYRLGAEVSGLVPTDQARNMLDPGGLLPEQVENIRLDAELDFTAPWDRRAVEQARPQITLIDLSDLSARWGDITFRAAGALAVDDVGRPEGQIMVRAVEWRRLLDMAEAVGLVPSSLRGSLETGLGLLSGPGDVLDVPLDFSDGWVNLGLIPLGPAPRIVIR